MIVVRETTRFVDENSRVSHISKVREEERHVGHDIRSESLYKVESLLGVEGAIEQKMLRRFDGRAPAAIGVDKLELESVGVER